MTRLLHLLNKQVIITRLVTVSGYKKTFSTVTSAMVEIQPQTPNKGFLRDGAVGKTFVIFTDINLDIQDNDMLRDLDSGKYYKVRNGGVSPRSQGSIEYNHVQVDEIT